MRRRLLITALLVAGAVGFFLWRHLVAREPTFEGRPLTRWLDHHVPSSAAIPPYGSPGWNKAHEAIRNIGTNGIPTLLKMIGTRDLPPFLLKLMEAMRRHGFIQIRYRYANVSHQE